MPGDEHRLLIARPAPLRQSPGPSGGRGFVCARRRSCLITMPCAIIRPTKRGFIQEGDMGLTGSQRKQIRDALLIAFTSRNDLEQLASFYLEQNLAEISQGTDLRQDAFALVV